MTGTAEQEPFPQTAPACLTRAELVFLVCLGILTGLIYAPMLRSFFFLANDFDLLGLSTFNPSADTWDWLALSPRNPRFPVFSAMFSLFGLAGWKYAAFCAALHWTNSALVFLLTYRLARSAAAARWTAVFFCVLPSSVFAVAYLMSTLRQALATFFTLAFMHLFTLFLKNGARKYYAAALAIFLLALNTHELAVTAPLILLLEPKAASKDEHKGRVRALWPFFCLGVAYTIWGWLLRQWRVDANFTTEHYYLGLHALKNLPEYLTTLAWPAGAYQAWHGAVFPFIAAAGLAAFPATRRLAVFSLAALAIALTPFLPITTLSLADKGKYAYFASVYFCLFSGLAAAQFSLKPYRWVFPALLAGAWAFHANQICAYQAGRRNTEGACLEKLRLHACAQEQAHIGALTVIWPEAEMFYLNETRIENYLAASCHGTRLKTTLLTKPQNVTAGTTVTDCTN
ncbi:MAG: hypothetical protein NDI60_05330 [Elusimicrobiales bacterium]|nr:hypothetical protein [Elusimicrobiales bacterium]